MLLYFNDLLVLVLMVNIFGSLVKNVKIALPWVVKGAIGILLLIVLLAYVLNLYSPLLLLWGGRNNFRAIIFFVACCMFLEKREVYLICNILIALLPLNVLLCTVQYLRAINSADARVLKFVGDYVGGIFGDKQSCNRMLNIYISFVFTWVYVQLQMKECSIKKAALIFLGCVYVAILSELKVVLVEFVVIMFIVIWLIQRKINKVLLTLLCVVAAISIIYAVNPSALDIFRSMDSFAEYASASSYGVNSLNRLTVIPYIQERFFSGNILKTLFGVGLGNADASNFSFLTSHIYRQHGYLKYHYFMSGHLFFEIGLLGLLAYLSIFIMMYIYYARKLSRRRAVNSLECAGVVFNAIALLCIFYNTSLRSEVSSYMAFFFLSIPIIWDNRCSESDYSYLQRNSRRLVVRW